MIVVDENEAVAAILQRCSGDSTATSNTGLAVLSLLQLLQCVNSTNNYTVTVIADIKTYLLQHLNKPLFVSRLSPAEQHVTSRQ
jgi:hypothetical protein